jgi:hypothetical protein
MGRGFSEQGRALHVQIDSKTYSAETVTVTLLTNLNTESGTYISNPRAGANAASDFLAFVLDCIAQHVRVLWLS